MPIASDYTVLFITQIVMFSNFRYLAINTIYNGLIWIAYIVFVTKMQKRQTLWNGFALYENDITGS
jgi:hypothetical protein